MAYIITNYGSLLFAAFRQTLILALLSLFFASIIGVFFGILGVLDNKICRKIELIFVDIIRGIPLIVLALYLFYGIPMFVNSITGGGFTISQLQVGVIALSLNCGAYMAEIIRAGILSVDKGQVEAARSLGLPYSKTLRKIVLPQAVKTMVPTIINQFIITLKDTSILSAIGFPELVNSAKNVIGITFMSFETWSIVAVMYLVVILLLTNLSRYIERRWNVGR
ncbi:MAG: amino acid ABC transporter permease [Eubacterium sp.]|nr:amino acid ABC transporter permease [Eubacterium sp.]